MEKLVNKELIEEIRGNDIKYYYVNFIYEDTNNLLNITNKIFNSNLHGSFHTVRDNVIFFNKIDATYYMNLVKGPATLEEEKYERYGGTPVSEHIYRLNAIDEYQTKLEYIRSYYAEYFNHKNDDVLALKITYNIKEIGDERILSELYCYEYCFAEPIGQRLHVYWAGDRASNRIYGENREFYGCRTVKTLEDLYEKLNPFFNNYFSQRFSKINEHIEAELAKKKEIELYNTIVSKDVVPVDKPGDSGDVILDGLLDNKHYNEFLANVMQLENQELYSQRNDVIKQELERTKKYEKFLLSLIK
jgi:hypothetical protein